jgi:multicomponent Na+:H+ antiporter subunit F
MIDVGADVIDAVVSLSLSLLSFALVLTFVRLVRGPSLLDRVVALELTATLVLGVIGVYAIGTDTPVLLDVAIALALVVFLGAVALARYAERAMRR